MTERAKRKGIEIGLGLLTYIIVGQYLFTGIRERQQQTVLFLVPYIILSATT